MKFVHVQSVLPQEDVIALKEKTGESSIKEAISKAIYHYLACDLVKKDKDIKWDNENMLENRFTSLEWLMEKEEKIIVHIRILQEEKGRRT